MAAADAVKEVILLRGLVSDLGLQQDETIVFCDSQSTIHLAKNQMYHERTSTLMLNVIFFERL